MKSAVWLVFASLVAQGCWTEPEPQPSADENPQRSVETDAHSDGPPKDSSSSRSPDSDTAGPEVAPGVQPSGTDVGRVYPPLPPRDFYDVWGSVNGQFYAVGEKGAFVHLDNAMWRAVEWPAPVPLRSIWGSSADDIYVLSESTIKDDGSYYPAQLVHWDGEQWSVVNDAPKMSSAGSIWGTGSEDIHITESFTGAFYHFDGTSWDWEHTLSGGISAEAFCSDGTYVAQPREGKLERRVAGRKWTTVDVQLGDEERVYRIACVTKDEFFVLIQTTPVSAAEKHLRVARWHEDQWTDLSGPGGRFYRENIVGLRNTGSASVLLSTDKARHFSFDADAEEWEHLEALDGTRLGHVWRAENGDIFSAGWRGEIIHMTTGGQVHWPNGRTHAPLIEVIGGSEPVGLTAFAEVFRVEGSQAALEESQVPADTADAPITLASSRLEDGTVLLGGGWIPKERLDARCPSSALLDFPENRYLSVRYNLEYSTRPFLARYDGDRVVPVELAGDYAPDSCRFLVDIIGDTMDDLRALCGTGVVLLPSGAGWRALISELPYELEEDFDGMPSSCPSYKYLDIIDDAAGGFYVAGYKQCSWMGGYDATFIHHFDGSQWTSVAPLKEFWYVGGWVDPQSSRLFVLLHNIYTDSLHLWQRKGDGWSFILKGDDSWNGGLGPRIASSREDALYLNFDGELFRFDGQALTRLARAPEGTPLSLDWTDGELFVGTVQGAIYRLGPSSGDL